jgi:hypothetical protein
MLLLLLVMVLLCPRLLMLSLCLLVLTWPHVRLLWGQAVLLLLLLLLLRLLCHLVKAVKQVAAGRCAAACLGSVLLTPSCR